MGSHYVVIEDEQGNTSVRFTSEFRLLPGERLQIAHLDGSISDIRPPTEGWSASLKPPPARTEEIPVVVEVKPNGGRGRRRENITQQARYVLAGRIMEALDKVSAAGATIPTLCYALGVAEDDVKARHDISNVVIRLICGGYVERVPPIRLRGPYRLTGKAWPVWEVVATDYYRYLPTPEDVARAGAVSPPAGLNGHAASTGTA